MRNAYLLAGMALVVLVAGQWAWAQAPTTGPGVDVKSTTNGGGEGAQPPTGDGAGQQGGATSKPAGEGDKPPVSAWDSMKFPALMIGGFILLYVWMGRGRKKQKKKREEMLESLKKGDKITTIGGIVGTVIEVRDDEVTVKVDENNNVRMKFARWSVRGVGDAGRAENPDQADQEKDKK